MREQSAFGMVLIRAGAEVGEVANTAEIGTTARIVDFYQLFDRLLGITCAGEKKFPRARAPPPARWSNVGTVEWLPRPEARGAGEHAHLAALLRKVLPELGEVYQQVPKHFDDAAWVGSRPVEIPPISLGDKQACLEMQDPLQRLADRAADPARRGDAAVLLFPGLGGGARSDAAEGAPARGRPQVRPCGLWTRHPWRVKPAREPKHPRPRQTPSSRESSASRNATPAGLDCVVEDCTGRMLQVA